MASDTPTISTTVTPPPHMYSFILLNIARLFTKTTSTYKVLFGLYIYYIAYQHYLYVCVRPF